MDQYIIEQEKKKNSEHPKIIIPEQPIPIKAMDQTPKKSVDQIKKK